MVSQRVSALSSAEHSSSETRESGNFHLLSFYRPRTLHAQGVHGKVAIIHQDDLLEGPEYSKRLEYRKN
jgi:hypothetical protein